MMTNVLIGDALPEYSLKTAYLYNFAVLTDWPENEDFGDFNVCLYGRNPLNPALNALKHKNIHNRNVTIRSITTPEEAKGCQILFIEGGERQKNQRMAEEISRLPILLVTDNPDLPDYHIAIVRSNDKLAFNVQLKPLQKSNLHLSSRLLKLAKKVTP